MTRPVKVSVRAAGYFYLARSLVSSSDPVGVQRFETSGKEMNVGLKDLKADTENEKITFSSSLQEKHQGTS